MVIIGLMELSILAKDTLIMASFSNIKTNLLLHINMKRRKNYMQRMLRIQRKTWNWKKVQILIPMKRNDLFDIKKSLQNDLFNLQNIKIVKFLKWQFI